MKRLLITAFLLLLLTGAAVAQVQVLPAYGSTAIVAGSAVQATGAQFIPAGTACYRACGYTLKVNNTITARVVQVTPVSLLAFLPLGDYVVNTIVIAGPMVNETVVIGETVTAAPVLTGQGSWASDVNGAGAPIVNGLIPQPANASVIQLALHGSDFGAITQWRLHIVGPGVNLEALFTLSPFTQAHPNLVFGNVGRLVGTYQVHVAAFNDPTVVSNAISLTFQ